MLVGQTSDYGRTNRSEGYVHRGRRDKSRATKSGGMGVPVICHHVIGTLLTCRRVKTERTDFGAQERGYRIGWSVGTRVLLVDTNSRSETSQDRLWEWAIDCGKVHNHI